MFLPLTIVLTADLRNATRARPAGVGPARARAPREEPLAQRQYRSCFERRASTVSRSRLGCITRRPYRSRATVSAETATAPASHKAAAQATSVDPVVTTSSTSTCLLYTSDAADEED